MKLLQLASRAAFALTLPLALSCADGPTTSTVTGRIDQSTFASQVTQITILDDLGRSRIVRVADDGTFELVLAKKKSYRFFVGGDASGLPIVLRADDGQLTATVRVKSGGASADLGALRFWAGDATLRSFQPDLGSGSLGRTVVPPGTGDASGACVEGYLEGTQHPCIGSVAPVRCEDDDSDSDSDSDDDSDDGEHEDADTEGTRAQHWGGDGAGDTNQIVDGALPSAIPELGLPASLSCHGDCHDDDHDSDGEHEETGEH